MKTLLVLITCAALAVAAQTAPPEPNPDLHQPDSPAVSLDVAPTPDVPVVAPPVAPLSAPQPVASKVPISKAARYHNLVAVLFTAAIGIAMALVSAAH